MVKHVIVAPSRPPVHGNTIFHQTSPHNNTITLVQVVKQVSRVLKIKQNDNLINTEKGSLCTDSKNTKKRFKQMNRIFGVLYSSLLLIFIYTIV